MWHIHVSSPIHHAFCGTLSGPISLMGIPIYCFLKTFQLQYLDSVLPARWCFLPTVYTCLNGVALAQHSEATLTPMVICMCVCVCVCGQCGHYSLSRQKNCTPRSLDSGLSNPGQIRIDAHRSKPCRRGRPRSLICIVCRHRSRLPTVVAWEQFVSAWATGRNSHLIVGRHSQSVFYLSIRNTHLS